MQHLRNPLGTHVEVDDFRTGVDRNGGEINYGRTVAEYRANADIKRGQTLSFVAPTTSTPLSVTPSSAATGFTFAGIANTDCDKGGLVEVTVRGHCLGLGGGSAAALDSIGGNASGKVVKVTPSDPGDTIGIATGPVAADKLGPVYLT